MGFTLNLPHTFACFSCRRTASFLSFIFVEALAADILGECAGLFCDMVACAAGHSRVQREIHPKQTESLRLCSGCAQAAVPIKVCAVHYICTRSCKAHACGCAQNCCGAKKTAEKSCLILPDPLTSGLLTPSISANERRHFPKAFVDTSVIQKHIWR